MNEATYKANVETEESAKLEETKADTRIVPIITTDLSSSQVHTVRAMNGAFPDIDRVIPDARNAKFSITLDAALLKSLMAQFDKFMDVEDKKSVRFYFTDNQSVVRMDADGGDSQHMTAVLMPIRPGEGCSELKAESKTA